MAFIKTHICYFPGRTTDGRAGGRLVAIVVLTLAYCRSFAVRFVTLNLALHQKRVDESVKPLGVWIKDEVSSIRQVVIVSLYNLYQS